MVLAMGCCIDPEGLTLSCWVLQSLELQGRKVWILCRHHPRQSREEHELYADEVKRSPSEWFGVSQTALQVWIGSCSHGLLFSRTLGCSGLRLGGTEPR